MPRLAAGSFCALGLVAVATAQTPASWPTVWNLVHPNAAALIGIDVRGIRDSALGQAMSKQFKTAGVSMPMMPGSAMLPGREFLDDIDHVLISSPGAKTPTRPPAGKTAATKEDPPFLAILTGHFPMEHLRPFLKGTPQAYSGVDVYQPDPKGNSSAAVLDESTLLFGDAASVKAAIDRRNGALKMPAPLLVRGAAMAANHDLWIIANVPPSAFQPSNMSLGSMAADISGLEFGMAMRDSFKLEISVATKTPEAAQRMAQLLTSHLQLAAAGKLSNPQAAEMMKKLQIAADGNRLGIRLEATREEMERNIQEMQKSFQAGSAMGAASEARPNTPPPPPAGTIRVYGMQGGVQEIPAETPKQR